MFVSTLCRQFCPNKLPVQLDERLGDGADGEVFSILKEPNKVIKLGVLYERSNKSLDKQSAQIEQTLHYLMTTLPQAYAHVYEYKCLGSYSRPMEFWPTGQQRFILYFYIMEKLLKISEDERKVFHSILSHEDRGIKKVFSPEKISEILKGLASGLDFDTEKVMLFCNNVARAKLSHLDMHPRNIMVNDAGDFRLIDFDRIQLEKTNVEE